MVLPLVVTLAGGVAPNFAKEGLTARYLIEVFANPVYRQGLLGSAAIAVVSTLLTFLIAVPLAWVASRYSFRGKTVAESLLLAPLILPPFVGALGVAQLFGQYGTANALGAALGLWARGAGPDWLGDHRFAAVCVIEALHLYPILYLNTSASLARLDPSLLEAAQGLGASPWTRFRRVVLPLIRPGLFGGGIVIAVWSFTELGTPLVLGYDRATPVQIFSGLSEIASGANPMPYALVVVLIAISAALYLVASRIFMRRHDALISKNTGAAAPTPLRGWRAALPWLLFGTVVVAATAPHLAVVLIAVAGDWYGTLLPSSYTFARFHDALAHPLVVPGVLNSLVYAGGATALALALGVFLAWMSARWKPRGWQAIDSVAMLPLAIPGVILAFGYLIMAMGIPWLRAWLDPIRNPTVLLIIAYAVRRLPQVVRSAHAGLAQVPVVYEEAAASLGAGLATRLRRITLPLIVGSLIAGALLTFSFSMLEVSDSLILAQKHEFFPVARVLLELVTILGPGPSIACAFAVWAMLFLAASLLAAAAVLGKGVGGVFRD